MVLEADVELIQDWGGSVFFLQGALNRRSIMLPYPLYRLLPYLYIAAGALLMLVIESDIIFLSILLLIGAGFMVLWMRYHPLTDTAAGSAHETPGLKTRNWNDVFQADQERRLVGITRTFPLIDNQGNLIPFDRRVGERRKSRAA